MCVCVCVCVCVHVCVHVCVCTCVWEVERLKRSHSASYFTSTDKDQYRILLAYTVDREIFVVTIFS